MCNPLIFSLTISIRLGFCIITISKLFQNELYSIFLYGCAPLLYKIKHLL